MKREDRQKAKEARKQAQIALRIEKKQAKLEQRAWEKMVARAKAKNAWID